MSEKQSKARKAEWADPEIRKRRSEGSSRAAKKRYEDPEERRKASERSTAAFTDPVKKQRLLEGVRQREERHQRKGGRKGSAGGLSRRPEYLIWRAMNQRCSNPNHKQWKDYGGRGIHVCDDWRGRGAFLRFFEHVGLRPSPKHSVGRIDNDGDYAPGNVRWETRAQQAANSRRNRLVTIGGETKHASEWARQIGLSLPAFLGRVDRGWPEERLLDPPKCRGLRARG